MLTESPTIVAVSGLSSNTGKTTLVCELRRRVAGWEAIKLTRGHYRSCGKDPLGCCVSDLLRDEPLIRSGRESNYEAGKDTGRFWDAGAVNVHWVIVGEDQVDCDGATALKRFMEWRGGLTSELNLNGLPIYTDENIPQIIERIHHVSESLLMTSVSSVSPW